jgi:hypothetical protein
MDRSFLTDRSQSGRASSRRLARAAAQKKQPHAEITVRDL